MNTDKNVHQLACMSKNILQGDAYCQLKSRVSFKVGVQEGCCIRGFAMTNLVFLLLFCHFHQAQICKPKRYNHSVFL